MKTWTLPLKKHQRKIKVKTFAALLVNGKEVTPRKECWLVIHIDGERLDLVVDRSLSFESPAKGSATVKYFETPTGQQWVMETALPYPITVGTSAVVQNR